MQVEYFQNLEAKSPELAALLGICLKGEFDTGLFLASILNALL